MNTIELFINDIDDFKVSLVDEPAIEQDFLTFAKEKIYFANEEKHLIVGAVMIPDLRILRLDENRKPYYVYFTKETIEKIAHSFIREGRLDQFNLQHNTDTGKVHIVESWLTDGKDSRFDVPEGSWMIAAKVEDPDIWDSIKAGRFNGFSLEGTFSYRDSYQWVIDEAEKIVADYEG